MLNAAWVEMQIRSPALFVSTDKLHISSALARYFYSKIPCSLMVVQVQLDLFLAKMGIPPTDDELLQRNKFEVSHAQGLGLF